jgi:hypothetical protein
MNSISSFILFDLTSQAVAFQRQAAGWSKEALILWLKEQGRLEELSDLYGNEIFAFESPAGFPATFYRRGTRFTGLGGHPFFQPK